MSSIEHTKLGIDFGTSNSSAALHFSSGELKTVQVAATHTSDLFPSVAFVEENGRILVCQEAENSAEISAGRFFQEFKLEIDDDEEVYPDSNVNREDLVAAILRRIKSDAEIANNNMPLDKVVLTIPAIYTEGDLRRAVMLRAATAAGFKEVELLLEPEAAAIYYAHKMGKTSTPPGALTLVYDLGAGTFDPALIRKTEDRWELIPVNLPGVPCAGMRFDAKLREHFDKTIEITEPMDDEGSYLVNLWIQKFLRDAKHTLSGAEKFEKREPIDRRLTYRVTRQEFNSMISPMLDETLDCCEQLLKRAKVAWKDIGEVLLVGGSCNIPLVREKIESRLRANGATQTRVCWSNVNGIYINPNHATSLGAALGRGRVETSGQLSLREQLEHYFNQKQR